MKPIIMNDQRQPYLSAILAKGEPAIRLDRALAAKMQVEAIPK
jgi:hypothetical protein